jgi:hypothetical protein
MVNGPAKKNITRSFQYHHYRARRIVCESSFPWRSCGTGVLIRLHDSKQSSRESFLVTGESSTINTKRAQAPRCTRYIWRSFVNARCCNTVRQPTAASNQADWIVQQLLVNTHSVRKTDLSHPRNSCVNHQVEIFAGGFGRGGNRTIRGEYGAPGAEFVAKKTIFGIAARTDSGPTSDAGLGHGIWQLAKGVCGVLEDIDSAHAGSFEICR